MNTPTREVRCPACGRPSLFAPQNRWRPFCCERCHGLDFGAWANERYRVASTAPTDDDETPTASDDPTRPPPA